MGLVDQAQNWRIVWTPKTRGEPWGTPLIGRRNLTLRSKVSNPWSKMHPNPSITHSGNHVAVRLVNKPRASCSAGLTPRGRDKLWHFAT